jgi:hypothetical protein
MCPDSRRFQIVFSFIADIGPAQGRRRNSRPHISSLIQLIFIPPPDSFLHVDAEPTLPPGRIIDAHFHKYAGGLYPPVNCRYDFISVPIEKRIQHLPLKFLFRKPVLGQKLRVAEIGSYAAHLVIGADHNLPNFLHLIIMSLFRNLPDRIFRSAKGKKTFSSDCKGTCLNEMAIVMTSILLWTKIILMQLAHRSAKYIHMAGSVLVNIALIQAICKV